MHCLTCSGENPNKRLTWGLLGLFFVFRGRKGGGVAAVEGHGNEPFALGIPFILEAIKQIQLLGCLGIQ